MMQQSIINNTKRGRGKLIEDDVVSSVILHCVLVLALNAIDFRIRGRASSGGATEVVSDM